MNGSSSVLTPEGYKALWVTGTDTGVGKTYVSAVLSALLNASYWKPVQSGKDGAFTDSGFVENIANNTLSAGISNKDGLSRHTNVRILPERYRLREPLSPHLAARLDGVSIKLTDFIWPAAGDVVSEILLMEGAGGVLVPLNQKHLIIDLMTRLRAPIVVVCRPGLGTINHSLLTIRALLDRGLPVCGFLFSGGENNENSSIIASYSGVRYLGHLPEIDLSMKPDFAKVDQYLDIASIRQTVLSYATAK